MFAWLAGAVLGVVFLAAGASKVRDPAWPERARAMGTPAALIPVVGWVELALGAALVVDLGRPWVPAGALALLGVFSGLIALRLAQGRRPPCACFGVRSARPLSPWHLVRNALLAGLALGALVGA